MSLGDEYLKVLAGGAPPKPPKKAKPRKAPATDSVFIRGDQTEIAAEYVRTLGEHAVFAVGRTFRYASERGVFEPMASADESCTVQAFAGEPVGDGGKSLEINASDVRGAIGLAHDLLARGKESFFENGPRGLALADCFLSVEGDAVVPKPHSPENRARHAYAFAISDMAVQPARFLTFLGEVFEGDADATEKSAYLQEFLGASLLGIAPRFQRVTCLFGPGADAKSTAMEIVGSVFPAASVTALPPQLWADQYRRALLSTSRLNAASELPTAAIASTDTFKAIVSGDLVDAREIYKPPFGFRCAAGHLFAANTMPDVNDTSHGFWRRWVVLLFNRKFEGAAADPLLASTIIATERPGIVAWMLEGAHRLMQRGHYLVPPSSVRAVDLWRKRANPVAQWVDERLEPLPAHLPVKTPEATTSLVLFRDYRKWAIENGHPAITSTKFGIELGKLATRKPHHSRSGTVHAFRFASKKSDDVTGCDGLVTGFEGNLSQENHEDSNA
ncbi:MAG: hypothetical protein HOO96_35965 [Polyangiaceae bacterium]|nr:hypothetical protein [Polyangiaceae bacterium]